MVQKQNERKFDGTGCPCYDRVGTLSRVNGNINAQKYINDLYNYLWHVIF